jgi:hypothetical protein
VQVVKSKDPKIPPRLRLTPEWCPSRDAGTGGIIAAGRLWGFTEKIASSRREGKNRRDGATVSTRVVRLTDLLGQKVFVEAKNTEGKGTSSTLSSEDAQTLRKDVKESRRRRTLENRAHL